MRGLTLLHRWWGIVFCLFFAMWFASGIVMHFAPFPTRGEADRFAGTAPIDLTHLLHGPAQAVAASGVSHALRIRLVQRGDGPVYLVIGPSGEKALRAEDLRDGDVHSERQALLIGVDDAMRRGLNPANARVDTISYDQWTVSGEFDSHRPLYRMALNDGPGTELYLSSMSGEVVLHTARRERLLNYFGSIAHWLYPTALRHHRQAWSQMMWWLSLLALTGSILGLVLGMARLCLPTLRARSPYHGWKAWHYGFGLVYAPFILSWIFSGWLSMDEGQLFSGGSTPAEIQTIAGAPAWDALRPDEIQGVQDGVKEVEWFALGSRIYRRERTGLDQQRLIRVDAERDLSLPERAFLQPDDVNSAAKGLARKCTTASAIGADDNYAVNPIMPGAPVFRMICGDDWFDIDGASGALLQKLDSSRRAYRWLFGGLHTLNFPALTSRPLLRTTIIVALCLCGLAFSLTGVVIAWRRLRLAF
jgi:PepSY-associated TM region